MRTKDSPSFPGYGQPPPYWLLLLQKHSFVGSRCENRRLNSSVAVPPAEISPFTAWEVWTTWLVLNFGRCCTPSDAKHPLAFLKIFSKPISSLQFLKWVFVTSSSYSQQNICIFLLDSTTKLPSTNNAVLKRTESIFSLTTKCQQVITQPKGTLRLVLSPAPKDKHLSYFSTCTYYSTTSILNSYLHM